MHFKFPVALVLYIYNPGQGNGEEEQGRQNGEDRTGQAVQDRQNGTGRTGQAEKDRQKITGRI